LEVLDEQFHLRILGIVDTQICPSAVGPAEAQRHLPDQPGVYALHVSDGNQRDTYRVTISDSLILASTGRATFTTMSDSVFQRAPRYSLAYYCTLPWGRTARDSTDVWACRDFRRILSDSLNAREVFFDANRGPLAFPVRNDLQREDVSYFQLEGPDDFRRAYDLLQRFAREVMAGRARNVVLELQNWRGALISSYLCRPEQPLCQSAASSPPY
jgi:hypothetical protein